MSLSTCTAFRSQGTFVPTRGIIYATVCYTLNTIQLYVASDNSVAVRDSAAGLVRFTKDETGNSVQLALCADKHCFMERRTQSQYVADPPIQTIFESPNT